ncbi:hypothetical protein NMA58_03150 [Rhizobium sp. YTUHZ045]|uniref:hypothetical protein n=1 Tax=Rhizobium sp. YTUHZ045 TaxID=2962888 RepID=UPI003DA85BEC
MIVTFIQYPDRVGVTFPERAISDAAGLINGNPSEIDGECSENGSYFEKKVSCEMRRTKGNKITDTISLEYELMFDSMLSFSDVRENLE